MAYLLGRGSAVEWLRQNRNVASVLQPWTVPYPLLEGSRTRLEPVLPNLAGLSVPYQLMVWTREDRRRTALTHSYMLDLRDGHYPAIRVTDELFVSTPEFTFLQMANVLDDERLLFLGFELCGRYGIRDGHVFMRSQTCTSQQLLAFAEYAQHIHGRKRALAVAPKVLEGAGSPMEAALALVLHAPFEAGGYGLAAPELNHSLPVVGDVRRLWPEDHITPDLLWEDAKLAIEYDSDEHHTAGQRIANDARRRDVLVELGYRVVTVTTEHIRSTLEVERIAGIVARALRADLAPQDAETRRKRAGFLARMRWMATHPEELTAKPKARDSRSWRPRHQVRRP